MGLLSRVWPVQNKSWPSTIYIIWGSIAGKKGNMFTISEGYRSIF